MSVFGMIKDAIWGHKAAPAAQSPAAAAPQAAPTPASPAPAAPAPAAAAPAAPAKPFDLNAVLTQKAAEKGQPLNWQTSIVDLMKVLDLDPSHDNRVSLAKELGYTGDIDDSATLNVWLHKKVMERLAE
jgi:3-oxoacyl-ACP reductase-like protein